MAVGRRPNEPTTMDMEDDRVAWVGFGFEQLGEFLEKGGGIRRRLR